jgi:glycosyltransferase involved in cell wall biosynthesis
MITLTSGAFRIAMSRPGCYLKKLGNVTRENVGSQPLKLIIQLPCYNEEHTLKETLSCLPRILPEFDTVEWLVIDDGSTDATHRVAKELGVEHIVVLPEHRGLAYAFAKGLETAVALGADVVINTDADNQYEAADIPKLLGPILSNKADFVIGERPLWRIREFSLMKRIFHQLGSWGMSFVVGMRIPDPTSGFRAISRQTAKELLVLDKYTYTLETIIRSVDKGVRLSFVPIRTNPSLRPSRLIKNLRTYLWNSIRTIVRVRWNLLLNSCSGEVRSGKSQKLILIEPGLADSGQ